MSQFIVLIRYQKYIERIVYSNLQQAQLGGVPGVFFLVKSFLKIRPLVAISHELEVKELISSITNGHFA